MHRNRNAVAPPLRPRGSPRRGSPRGSHADELFRVQMRLIHAEGSGGVLRGGTWFGTPFSLLLFRACSCLGSPGGSLGGSLGGFRGGIARGWIPRGSPEVLGRFWVDCGSFLGRCWDDSQRFRGRFGIDFHSILAAASAFLPRCRALQVQSSFITCVFCTCNAW